MAETIARLMHWRLHLVVLVLACLAEVIGIIQIDIGIGTVVLLPLLYAFFFSLLFNPNIVSGLGNVVGKQGAAIAPRWILICMMPFMAKFAIGIGPQIGDIIAAGPALILQELGNVATLLIAMPVAVLLFNMGRETIGATHSIAREPNIALVADRYGLKSSEGIGVMGVYVMGTVFGGVYFSLVAGLFASWEVFDIRSLAMACGVGSGSMMGACSTALAETVPDAANEISAFAATSNLLTYGTGLFVSAFIALPLAERLFTVLAKVRRQKASASNFSAYTDEEWESGQEGDTELPIRTVLAALVWVCVLALVVNWVNSGVNPLAAAPGMVILYVCCIGGLLITKYVRIGVPNVAWISVVAILAALPFLPWSEAFIAATDQLNMLALLTPALTYSGLAISRTEVSIFKKSGVQIAVIALLVFTGTFVGSAAIANVLL